MSFCDAIACIRGHATNVHVHSKIQMQSKNSTCTSSQAGNSKNKAQKLPMGCRHHLAAKSVNKEGLYIKAQE